MIAASVFESGWSESGRARVPAQIVGRGDHRAPVLEPDPGIGERARREQGLRRLGAPGWLSHEDEGYSVALIQGRDVRDEAAVRRPGRVVAIAIEGGAGQRALVQRQHPDVPPLDGSEVQQEAAAVGRELRMVEVAAGGDQPARARAVHEHERRRLLRDVGDIAVGRYGELGHRGSGDGDVGPHRHGWSRQPAALQVERRGLHVPAREHEHEQPLRHPRLDHRRAEERGLGAGLEIHQERRARRYCRPGS